MLPQNSLNKENTSDEYLENLKKEFNLKGIRILNENSKGNISTVTRHLKINDWKKWAPFIAVQLHANPEISNDNIICQIKHIFESFD